MICVMYFHLKSLYSRLNARLNGNLRNALPLDSPLPRVTHNWEILQRPTGYCKTPYLQNTTFDYAAKFYSNTSFYLHTMKLMVIELLKGKC